ncbi:MAG TPA: 6-carboxytetrahydropterin synthase [Candidatus Marinimicrobia bacterium]|jgi:6-pyruvoyltetrahydropterin/6-carboxytetrahydropterin synthase|uniref:6-pyruvoyl tetrahydrobiopterin synthase n=1 Tax=marine metagenome TaxID=408172 RepID=A0A383BMJ3_9ZZZZ|nr:6-carboxytetrahydropterin synthase [Candidatus Neomarinimicrobiota bacterium]HIM53045.1 6-carboxytetrahydropterin synthase [Candidatus Neomarinimicrobiota bacterium]HIO40739.1 6-carboxytetrahydropterin synthase [Candidatus Neomarinimicrobiota bacterium]
MPFITKQYKFCAAHRYWNNRWTEAENFENFGDDIYLHGHNYNLDITISGEINTDSGFIVNLQKLNNIVQENVISIMDHSQIEKDIDWFENRQPSTENMVVFIWERLVGKIPSPAKLHSIKLQETPTISTTYFGPK